MFRQICNFVETVLEKLVAILCLILLLCLFVEVVNRYFIGSSWPEIQFIIPFCFLWMCMLGSALAVRRKQHFEVDLLSKLLKGAAQRLHRVVMTLSVVVAGGVIVWASIAFVELGLLKKSPATGIRMVYIYASILLGGLLISLMAIEQLFVNQLTDDHSSKQEIE